MGHWPKPEREDYETYEIYLDQLELWKDHEAELAKDYEPMTRLDWFERYIF